MTVSRRSSKSNKGIILLIIFITSFFITCLSITAENHLNKNITVNNGIDSYDYTNPPAINFPVNMSDISESYYFFRNNTLYKSNLTWNSIQALTKDVYGGYNSSTKFTNEKDLLANIEAARTLLDLYEANLSSSYLIEAENILKYVIETFWNESNELFISNVDRTGNPISYISYCSENAIVIDLLLEINGITDNSTYLQYANRTILGMNNTLWDENFYGYYRSSNDSDLEGDKYLYDNALAMLINYKIAINSYFNSIIRGLASDNFKTIYNKIKINLRNGTNGYFSKVYRNWSLLDFNTEKDLNDNSIMLNTYIKLFKATKLDVYYQEILNLLNFMSNFIDNSKEYPAFLYKVNWDGSSIINATIFTEYNAMMIINLLDLYRITENASYYLQGNDYYNFIDTYLWDPSSSTYNCSITFGGNNNSLKYIIVNSIAIRSLISFKIENFYLTRANSTLSLILNHLESNNGLNSQIFIDWTYFFGLLGKIKYTSINAFSIISFIEAAKAMNNPKYAEYAEKIANFLIDNLRINEGFVFNATDSGKVNKYIYTCEDNALMVAALIDLYKYTANSTYLQVANSTWYFINSTFWDSHNGGYNSSVGPSGFNKDYKSLSVNSRVLEASLKILELNDPIFNPIMENVSLMTNRTLKLINDNLWDSISYGYYWNSSKSWDPIKDLNDSKNVRINSEMINILQDYNDIYPAHGNYSKFNSYCINLTNFLIENFIDENFGGIYIEGFDNGTIVKYDKGIASNSAFVSALLRMYKEFGNINYYRNATHLNNYANFYFWDFEYGGYFTQSNRRGEPIGLGNYYFKFLESNLRAVNMLLAINAIESTKNNYMIILENNEKVYDLNEKQIPISIELYDSNCLKINSSRIYFLLEGTISTAQAKKIRGLGASYVAINNSNIYTASVNISNFIDLVYIGVNGNSESIINPFYIFNINRTLPRYLKISHDVLNFITNNIFSGFMFWDYENYGFNINATTSIKSTFDNLMAVRSLLNFYKTTGLNYTIDWTNGYYDQVLLNYMTDILTYLENISIANNTLNKNLFVNSTVVNNNVLIKSSNTTCIDNSLAIIAYLELYEYFNDAEYLEIANNTWNYVNETFWDDDNLGFLKSNWSLNLTNKDLISQIWAILAYSEISNTIEINEITRNSSLKLLNITINNILENLWDFDNSGFYSEFNSTTWMPFNESEDCKKTKDNTLAIKSLLKLYNISGNSTFYNKAEDTLTFLDNYLLDNSFGGYYTALNSTNYLTNSNKSTEANAYIIDELIEFYILSGNYSYYDNAEKIAFYLTTYTYLEGYSLFIPKTSRVGSGLGQDSNINIISNLLTVNSFIDLEKIRTNFDPPLLLFNITTNSFDISSSQKYLTIYFEITDENETNIENVSVYAFVYGEPQLFKFIRSNDNRTYYRKFDITRYSKTVDFFILILNDSYVSTYKEFEYEREFPAYVKTAYETIATLFKYLQSQDFSFYASSFSTKIETGGNLLMIQAILDTIDLVGSTLLRFNWEGNDTLLNNIDRITDYLENTFSINNTQNLTGYLDYTQDGDKNNQSTLIDNALAVITFLNVYNYTNNSYYLNLANRTWLFLNDTFWNPTWNCYMSSNSTYNDVISVSDNFMAILAGLKINNTIQIDKSIRTQAIKMVNITYTTINGSSWDNTNGGYYTTINGSSWSAFEGKSTLTNSLSILANLELHSLFYNTSYYNLSCYRMANITSDIMELYLWDPAYDGFYNSTYNNWTIPNNNRNTSKYTLENSWAALAFTELYSVSKDVSTYYISEKTLQFIITYMGNQTRDLTTTGIFLETNKSGHIYGYPLQDVYPGTLISSSMFIHSLLNLFETVNISYNGNWLNGSVEFSAANIPPLGEYLNISFTLKDKYNDTQTGNVNITVIKWYFEESVGFQHIYNNLETKFNENTSSYKTANINISNSELIFIYISAQNDSFASYYEFFYIIRVPTDIRSAAAYKNEEELRYLPVFGGNSEDPETDFAYYVYVLGEDTINIRARYVEIQNVQYVGISNAAVNATIYFTNNGSKLTSKIVYTDNDGWFEVSFGPVANQSILEGLWNITLFASHVNNTIKPNTWFSSTTHLIRVSIGYGLFIANYTTKNNTIAQGDIFRVNITIKNERISNATTNISFFGEGKFVLEINKSVNLAS
ncbi:MAG: hypothetical protein EU551_01985, partial [Promethearchaeota archaeon]